MNNTILNLDCAAKTSLYPGVLDAIGKAANHHNPQSPSFLGRRALSERATAIETIANHWQTTPENLFFADTCSEVLRKLRTEAQIKWHCYNIEHSAATSLAENTLDFNTPPWDALPLSEDMFWLQSITNHELGIYIAPLFTPNKIIDATTIYPTKTVENFYVLSAGKSGALPFGMLIAKDSSKLTWTPQNDLVRATSLAAAYTWMTSQQGKEQKEQMPLIKDILFRLEDLGWVPFDSASDRLLTFITPYPTDLLICEGERFGLALSGGSACASGSPTPNKAALILAGEASAEKTLRLSWDLTWSQDMAQEAILRLVELDNHMRSY